MGPKYQMKIIKLCDGATTKNAVQEKNAIYLKAYLLYLHYKLANKHKK